jgi:hypothetical protein
MNMLRESMAAVPFRKKKLYDYEPRQEQKCEIMSVIRETKKGWYYVAEINR